MRSKIFGLLLLMALPLAVGAQNKTYTVQKGDTVEGIAKRFQVRQAELVALNALSNSHKLQIGEKLRIPAAKNEKTAAKSPTASKGATYTVRNGDSDWTIARKHNITVKELKALNPNVSFSPLKLGVVLNVPGSKNSVVAEKKTESKPETKVASTKPSDKKPSTSTHTVKKGENDWLIARKYDTKVAVLKELNPGVDLTKIRPGQYLRVPAPKGSETVAKTNAKPEANTKVASQQTIRTKHAVVKGDNSIIRRNPSTGSEKVTMVSAGTEVAVLDYKDGWYKLRFPKGTVGWMRGDLLKPLSGSEVVNSKIASNDKKDTKKTTTVASNKSEKPAAKSTAKKPGDGLVASNYKGRTDVVQTALDQLGTRYRWAGSSRGGFDCSGLVSYAFQQHGIKLPRTSREMASAGVAVSRSNLQKGDLVLFKTRRGAYVSHVGIYIGNGQFVHSSSGKGKVMVSSLNEGYYDRAFVTARRVSKGASAAKTVAKAETKKVEQVVKPASSEVKATEEKSVKPTEE